MKLVTLLAVVLLTVGCAFHKTSEVPLPKRTWHFPMPTAIPLSKAPSLCPTGMKFVKTELTPVPDQDGFLTVMIVCEEDTKWAWRIIETDTVKRKK